MFNIETKKYLRRTQWQKMHTHENIIAQMNDMASNKVVKLADIINSPTGQEPEATEVLSHVPPVREAGIAMTVEEANIVDDEIEQTSAVAGANEELPELIDREDDDSDDEDEDKNQEGDSLPRRSKRATA